MSYIDTTTGEIIDRDHFASRQARIQRLHRASKRYQPRGVKRERHTTEWLYACAVLSGFWIASMVLASI